VPHLLPEAESIPVALTLNELFTNAIKHSQGGDVQCQLSAAGDIVRVRIASRARLAEGFDLDQRRSAVSGLGLVRALLPRRSATMALVQEGEEVAAHLELRPPGVRVPAPDTAAA
jgi:two-component sensor histidine kinase